MLEVDDESEEEVFELGCNVVEFLDYVLLLARVIGEMIKLALVWTEAACGFLRRKVVGEVPFRVADCPGMAVGAAVCEIAEVFLFAANDGKEALALDPVGIVDSQEIEHGGHEVAGLGDGVRDHGLGAGGVDDEGDAHEVLEEPVPGLSYYPALAEGLAVV